MTSRSSVRLKLTHREQQPLVDTSLSQHLQDIQQQPHQQHLQHTAHRTSDSLSDPGLVTSLSSRPAGRTQTLSTVEQSCNLKVTPCANAYLDITHASGMNKYSDDVRRSRDEVRGSYDDVRQTYAKGGRHGNKRSLGETVSDNHASKDHSIEEQRHFNVSNLIQHTDRIKLKLTNRHDDGQTKASLGYPEKGDLLSIMNSKVEGHTCRFEMGLPAPAVSEEYFGLNAAQARVAARLQNTDDVTKRTLNSNVRTSRTSMSNFGLTGNNVSVWRMSHLLTSSLPQTRLTLVSSPHRTDQTANKHFINTNIHESTKEAERTKRRQGRNPTRVQLDETSAHTQVISPAVCDFYQSRHNPSSVHGCQTTLGSGCNVDDKHWTYVDPLEEATELFRRRILRLEHLAAETKRYEDFFTKSKDTTSSERATNPGRR